MKKKAKKLSKAKLWTIISAIAVVLFSLAIIITNIFIPVKYLASYCVSGKRVREGIMRVTFVDVGYGDCIIVELPDGKNMLIDAGDGRYSNNSKVLKELNRRDIDTIDYLICSSVNGEHCGGLAEVLKYKTVKTIYMPYCKNKYVTDGFRAFADQTEKSGAEIIYSEYKVSESGAEYFFTFLSPSLIDIEGGQYADFNSDPSKSTRDNSSAVLWLEYYDTAFLFTSDVETKILESIVSAYEISPDDYPVNLEKCKIVQLAGHGSEVSACARFYDLSGAYAAVVSVGAGGNGCPSVKVMTDITNIVGKRLYRTDENGNVIIEVSIAGFTVK